MGEIVRRENLAPTGAVVRIDRSMSKALASVRGDALLREAAELVSAHIAQVRIDAGHQLATRTALELKGLHGLVTEISRDDPGLELQLRAIEEVVAVGSQQIILRYMMRPL